MTLNSASILVVDDEPQIRRTLRTTLYSAGYHVLEAKDGAGAIDATMRYRPDLVLLDVHMPDISGLELCGKLRQSFAGPIIMVTVCSSARDKMAAFHSASRVRSKPAIRGHFKTGHMQI
jgi:two-component system, OmpR family, KDP operon response regulator KdpE